MVTNIHEHKSITIPDNSLLFTESIQNTTQIRAKIITSGFFRVSTGALA